MESQLPSKPTPLPKLQLFVLLYLQLAEPVTAFVVNPFINQLILEYGIADGDEKKVGYYAGAVSSLFFLSEMVCVYHWGRLSDVIGRRPVLMMGVVGLICSSISFGLSKTFAAILLSRAVSGALNGNAGVIKSMLAEITDESNQAQAFSFMHLVFVGGVSIASLLGGSLSHPYERFPNLFEHFQFWKQYPYALPCFVAAGFCVSALVLASTCLTESLSISKKPARVGYMTAAKPIPYTASRDIVSPTAKSAFLPKSTPPTIREVLTPRVRIAILNYGTFAMLSIMFTTLQPLFLSTPIAMGGLGLGSSAIGVILALTGILNATFQLFFYAPLDRRCGTRNLFLVANGCYFLTYLSWPLMSVLARRSGGVDAATIAVLAFQLSVNMLCGMGFSGTQIFITSAAPTRNTLGTTNGISQTFASFSRAVGPATSSSLFAFSLESGMLGGNIIYIVLVLYVFLSLLAASRLPKVVKRASEEHPE